jgi:TolA-binding protein
MKKSKPARTCSRVPSALAAGSFMPPVFAILAATLFLCFSSANAKLAASRWNLLTEEERHQLTRAERYVEQNNFKSALAEYELFIQLYGKSEIAGYAQFMFADCTRRLGQLNTAIKEFRNVLDYFPDTLDAGNAQFSIGLCQTQTGDIERAVVAFEKVIEKWAGTDFAAQARSEAATIYWRLGRKDQWLSHMRFLASEEYQDTQNLRFVSQQRLATHYLLEGKPQEALEITKARQRKQPLLTLAEWAVDFFQPNKVQPFYGDAGLKALPAVAEGTVSFLEKQVAGEGDAELKNAVSIRCYRILAAAGVKEKTLERMASMLKTNPENDRIRMDYATQLRNTGNRNEARLVYRELKDQYVADREVAETYNEEHNYSACIDACKAMLTKHPQRASDIHWTLGEVSQRAGKYQDAIASYTQSQKEPQALMRISECQGSLKQHDAAIQTLAGVLNFFKSSAPEAHYRISTHYAAKGDKEAAIRTLKAICKTHLNTSWAGRAHQDLSLTYGIDVTLGGAAAAKPEAR